jgi:hypothetical protein
MTHEKRRPEFIFEITDSSADGGFLHRKRGSSLAKTPIVDGGNKISQLVQPDRRCTGFPLNDLCEAIIRRGLIVVPDHSHGASSETAFGF